MPRDRSVDQQRFTTRVRLFQAGAVTVLAGQIILKHLLMIAQEIHGAARYVLQTFRPTAVLDPSILDSGDPGFSAEAMERLQALVLPWVPRCSIR